MGGFAVDGEVFCIAMMHCDVSVCWFHIRVLKGLTMALVDRPRRTQEFGGHF